MRKKGSTSQNMKKIDQLKKFAPQVPKRAKGPSLGEP